jgi:hypothetical protein
LTLYSGGYRFRHGNECRGRAWAALRLTLALALTQVTLAFASNAFAVESYTWTGEAPIGESNWSGLENWTGFVEPIFLQEAVGTLQFPLLNSLACALPATATCYYSNNDLSGLAVHALSLADDTPQRYMITGKGITLGSGGITVTSTGKSGVGPDLELPVALGKPQIWSLDGEGGFGGGGLEVQGAVTGEGNALTVLLNHRAVLGLSNVEVGPVTITNLTPSVSSFVTVVGALNASDGHAVSVNEAHLAALGTVGPLTANHATVEPGEGGGSLGVNGKARFENSSQAQFQIFGAGTTPGSDFTQFTASSAAELLSANLSLGILQHAGKCPTLTVGASYTLIQANGGVLGTFANAPPGSTIGVGFQVGCPVPSVKAQITYTANSVVATLVGATTTPVDQTLPGISGSAVVGQTLTEVHGTWTGSPTSYTYQWSRCEREERCGAIAGATGQTYNVQPADVGDTIVVAEIAHNASGASAPVSSQETGIVQVPPVPVNTSPPGVQGPAVIGQTLEEVHGAWTGSPTGYSYQWENCVRELACSAIAGATGQTYVVQANDAGRTIRVREVASNGYGVGNPAYSYETGVVPAPAPPSNVALPSIGGSAVALQTLTEAHGGWTGSPTSYAFQWESCVKEICSVIPGATAQTYMVQASDVDKTLRVSERASNAQGAGAPAFSPETGIVAAAPNDPGGGIPAPTCASSRVQFSLFTAYSACFTKRGGVWSAAGRVRINGIEVDPAGGSIEINPSVPSLSATRSASVYLGSLRVYDGPLRVGLGAPFKLTVASGTTLKGLPLVGELVLEPVTDGMTVKANATVGGTDAAITSGFTGEVELHVNNKLGLELNHLSLALNYIELAKPKEVVIEKASLTYSHVAGADVWTGTAEIGLPYPIPGFGGTLGFTNGHISEVGIEVSGLNIPVGAIVYLQKLGLDVRWQPTVAVTGTLGVSAGPRLPKLNAPIVELDTSLGVEFATPTVFTATGELILVGTMHVAHAEAKWTVPDRFQIFGEASFSVGPAKARFKGSGLINGEGFGFFAEGEVSVPAVTAQGLAYVSEKGITACASVTAGPTTVFGGFGYYWAGNLELWADACEMLKFKTAAHISAAGPGTTAFQVPRGQTQTIIGARGETGYPQFTLRSPAGQIVSSAAGEQGAVGSGGYRWVTDPTKHGTYVLLGRPEPGTWTLTPVAGSPPINWSGSALAAAPARLRSVVKRHGRGEQLTWTAQPVAGQAIRFEEVGRRVTRVIVSTSRSRGKVNFKPTDSGSPETRHIQAEVSLNGLPRKVSIGAAFTVTPTAPPTAPGHVAIVRRGRTAIISWTRAARAAFYQIDVRASDGRRFAVRVKAREHAVILQHVIAPLRVAVSVATVATDGREGGRRLAKAEWRLAARRHAQRRTARHHP